MTSFTVVETFDVLKNGLFRFFSRAESIQINTLFLDEDMKSLDTSIVVTVTTSRHAHLKMMFL